MICPNSSEVGLVVDGGYAEEIVVADEKYLVPLGDLDPIHAAPLACGGLTAYRATKKALVHLGHQGSRVCVIGAGGLGQYAIQYLALLSDAEITVVDTSPDKRASARELGAHQAGTIDDLHGSYDAIIDFVGADATLHAASGAVARQGIVVVVGLFGGRVAFGLGAQANEASLTTSIWGTLDELHELIALARAHSLKSPVETMKLSQAQAAHDRLRRGRVAGRIVLIPDALSWLDQPPGWYTP
jgi:propanol-preferring alcohol dehydrogenase